MIDHVSIYKSLCERNTIANPSRTADELLKSKDYYICEVRLAYPATSELFSMAHLKTFIDIASSKKWVIDKILFPAKLQNEIDYALCDFECFFSDKIRRSSIYILQERRPALLMKNFQVTAMICFEFSDSESWHWGYHSKSTNHDPDKIMSIKEFAEMNSPLEWFD
jgi:hypothetical protein